MTIFQEILKRTLQVPVTEGTAGNGETTARQLDVALMSVGFKLSGELLGHLSGLHPTLVKETAEKLLGAVRELVGDHVRHNVYFKEFPKNVPDTREFWLECIVDALFDEGARAKVTLSLSSFGVINLLDLPKYGRYQHSYEEMLTAHKEFIPSAKDQVIILNLGKSLPKEAVRLYHSLAGSVVPLNEDDRRLLQELAKVCLTDPQPETIKVRENKAIINRVRLENNQSLLTDTVTDVLRLACALSDGDVTLQESTRFKSFPRKVRRAMLEALNGVIEKAPVKLADVNQYRERFKRLGERLHPHEYSLPHAQDVFAVARGEKKARSLAAKVEIAFAGGNIGEAVSLLATAPGMLFRNLDRILRSVPESELGTLLKTVQTVIGKVSGRVILSVREHLQNRVSENTSRIFANSKGKAWVTGDNRKPLNSDVVGRLFTILDTEVLRRIPDASHLVVDSRVLNLALPLSDKNKAHGFGIMPRGSVSAVANSILRFFVYWKEKSQRTDYDLSVLMLDENFQSVGQVSWTNLRYGGGDTTVVHSGDLTEASNGASEFIDVNLSKVRCKYIIPQVNVFAGENFNEAEESFFGFMERTPEQKGKPFEARTVRMKSELRGSGRVALPLAFVRDVNGQWTAKWLHMYLNGQPNFNRVEANRASIALIARSVVNREYLCLQYLVDLMRRKATSFSWYDGREIPGSSTFIGIEAPERLPAGSKAVTLNNLQELIPA